MQYLGEIYAAQRSRGENKQDKRQVKPRKEIQKRSFWRRFFSSFLSLLKEKRPPEANKESDPRRSAELPPSPRKESTPSETKTSAAKFQKENTILSDGVSFWSGRRGSNSLPRPWQGRALPDELRPQTQGELYRIFPGLSTLHFHIVKISPAIPAGSPPFPHRPRGRSSPSSSCRLGPRGPTPRSA